MDGALNRRHQALLAKLKARTKPDGSPKPNYAENVAAIRAELAMLQEKMNGR